MLSCRAGDLETDNNRAEQSLLGSDNGGQTAAILTSFIARCKRLEINPFIYPPDVFQRISAYLMNRLDELLPDTWEAAPNASQNASPWSPTCRDSWQSTRGWLAAAREE